MTRQIATLAFFILVISGCQLDDPLAPPAELAAFIEARAPFSLDGELLDESGRTHAVRVFHDEKGRAAAERILASATVLDEPLSLPAHRTLPPNRQPRSEPHTDDEAASSENPGFVYLRIAPLEEGGHAPAWRAPLSIFGQSAFDGEAQVVERENGSPAGAGERPALDVDAVSASPRALTSHNWSLEGSYQTQVGSYCAVGVEVMQQSFSTSLGTGALVLIYTDFADPDERDLYHGRPALYSGPNAEVRRAFAIPGAWGPANYHVSGGFVGGGGTFACQ